MELTAIYRFPVKSLAGEHLDAVGIGPRGPHRDRHWMVVDDAGRFVTQRECPRMCLVSAALPGGDDVLTLSAPRMPDLIVDDDGAAAPVDVVVWRDRVAAAAPDPRADAWLSEFLARPCRLVRLREDSCRPVDPAYAAPSDEVGFADGFPWLLISQASLDDLSGRVGTALQMLRFRPNLVVDGCAAFAEDGWQRIRIGEVTFRVAKPCARCTVPTIDPHTAARDPSITRTLMTYRRRDRAVMFGQNLLHDGPGVLRRGMPVEVLA